MARVFFPSCKIKADFPAESEDVRRYLEEQHGVTTTGCCKPCRTQLTDADQAVVICNNCAAIVEESSAAPTLTYVWELIDQDTDFPFPDHSGMQATIQDCWAARERRSMQEAIRSLLRKMNIEIVELAENQEHTKFCGISLYQPQPARNPKLAPKRFLEGAKGLFQEHTQEEKKRLMEEHCAQIATDKVAAYCHYCLLGLNLGGKKGFHLARLLFEPENVCGGNYASR